MTGRLQSAIHFMLDAFIISLVLVFVSSEASLPVVWSWLLSALVASCICCYLFTKHPYRASWVIWISIIAAGGMWGTGMPMWLAAMLGMLAMYLLHAHYSVTYEEFSHDHNFLMKFVLVFSICWVILLLNPDQQASRLLFMLVPVGVLFYTCSYLLSGYFFSRTDGARFSQAALAFSAVAGVSTIAAIITFFLAEEVRRAAGSIVGGAIQVLFWPLALLLEQASEFLSGLSTEQEMKETIDKLGPDEEAVRNDTAMDETMQTDFPVEILLGVVVLASAIMIVLWMKKIKTDSKMPEQESKAVIKRYEHTSAEQHAKTPVLSSGHSLDLHQIRVVFRGLEHMATDYGQGREKYETVREWMRRLEWDVAESFYRTYDQVRYGDEPLPDMQVSQFINEIEKIKGKYFKENV